MSNSEFRQPTVEENRLIQRLLEADFEGKKEVAAQIAGVLVRPLDDDGCLEFKVRAGQKAFVTNIIPVEAEALDRDDVMIHALLHVVNGVVHELELYKEDNSRIVMMPKPEDWVLLVLG
jgi:hypothetical protein